MLLLLKKDKMSTINSKLTVCVCVLVFRSHNAMATKGQDMDLQSKCPSCCDQSGFSE